MMLQDALPDGVTVNGKRVKCDFDFRNVLKMLEILDNRDILPEARNVVALRCIMKRIPKDTRAAIRAVFDTLFQKDGEQQQQNKKPMISMRQDADLIRAAFLQVYGINLYRDKLHYLEFTELLSNLPEGCRFSDVVGIRAREIPAPTKYNAKERENLMRLKMQYAIRLTAKEQEAQYEKDVQTIFAGLLAIAEKEG